MSTTRSAPWATRPERSNPSESPHVIRSCGDSSTASTSAGVPLRATLAAIWSPRMVLPVPLRPATRVDRDSGMPP